MSMQKYWLWLTTRKGMGPGAALAVARHFSSPEQAFFADPAEYELIPGLSREQRDGLKDKSMELPRQIDADCRRLDVRILTLQDSDYPGRLRQIDVPPAVLYVRGRLPLVDEEAAIAMAGTRKCSPYGEKMAGLLAYQITRLGGLVVTGVVEGCDRAAATAALKAGGPVVCVLAGGVDVPYHRSCQALYQDVAQNGALISEYPPGTPHLGRHFPVRNRILTGLCLGVVCVEAAAGSGTLLVADLALEQSRDVFAVPGNADAPASAGTNGLLKQGAIPVENGADVLNFYTHLFPRLAASSPPDEAVMQARLAQPAAPPAGHRSPAPEKSPAVGEKPVDNGEECVYIDLKDHWQEFTDDERDILLMLRDGPMTVDDLIDRTQIPAGRLSQTLTLLELRGLAEKASGQRFRALARLVTEE